MINIIVLRVAPLELRSRRCHSEVTVTSIEPPSFVLHRGIQYQPTFSISISHPSFASLRGNSIQGRPRSRPRALPCLSTIFRIWVLFCAPTGCSILFSFLFLCSLCLCVCPEVTVTSISHLSFVSHRGLFRYKPSYCLPDLLSCVCVASRSFNTNPRSLALSLSRLSELCLSLPASGRHQDHVIGRARTL